MNLRATFVATFFLAAPAVADTQVRQLPGIVLESADKVTPNGEYTVFVHRDNQWREAGRLPYNRFFQEKRLDLGALLPQGDVVEIKIAEKGGGAAHIDSVFFGGKAPLKTADSGLFEKVSRKDFDVVDAYGKEFVFSFPASAKDKTLALTARVEATVISKIPFQFPPTNLFREMNASADFYRYRLKTKAKAVAVSAESLTRAEPFFKEYSRAGSGHPSGFTYGWVENDDKNLYVSIDFTSDDTFDGDKDYAKVYVKSPKGLSEFKVSQNENTWGRPSFAKTERAAYQHKSYDFKIPLKDMGAEQAGQAKELQLAFATYGTSSPAGNNHPALAFDPSRNRYLVVYDKLNGTTWNYDVYGQLINHDGTPIGAEFVISDGATNQWHPRISFDSVNNDFLVVWQDFRNAATTSSDIYGQLINGDGTLRGANFVICDAVTDQWIPSVAFDKVNLKFLVTWPDMRSGNADIYGQLVLANGALAGANFPIANLPTTESGPAVSYDGVNQRFLVAWEDSRSYATNGADLYGQLVNADGSLNGGSFAVSTAPKSQITPGVSFDEANQRFFAVWDDWRAGATSAIFGRLLNADGTSYGPEFQVSNGSDSQSLPAVAFDSLNRRNMVAWVDRRTVANTSLDIYGQSVNADGTMDGANFAINNATDWQESPALAYNSICANILAAYGTGNGTSITAIGLTLVGPGCEAVAPTVSSTSPAGGETGVASTSAVTATFSEPMRASSLNPATFTLTDGATPVAGTVTVSGATATFAPSVRLTDSTVYTATITTGATDLVGNALAADYSWTFTVGNPAGANKAAHSGCGCGTEGSAATLPLIGLVGIVLAFRRRRMLAGE